MSADDSAGAVRHSPMYTLSVLAFAVAERLELQREDAPVIVAATPACILLARVCRCAPLALPL